MLSPAVAKLWWDQYVAPTFSPSGRAVALHIASGGRKSAFVSVYAPHAERPASEREAFRDELTTLLAAIPVGTARIAGGDWNASIHADMAARLGCGTRLLPGSTSSHAQDVLGCLNDSGLSHLDSHLATRHRATFRFPQQTMAANRWREYDYFATDMPCSAGLWCQLRTGALPFGDHFFKRVRLQLPAAPGAKERRIARGPPGTVQSGFGDGARHVGPIRREWMQGPSAAATALREQYSAAADAALDARGAPEEEMAWDDLAAVLRASAVGVVGRSAGVKVECPFVAQLRTIGRQNATERRLAWDAVRRARGTPGEEAAVAAHRETRRRHRLEYRQARARLVKEVAADLTRAAADNDTGAQYRGLRRLGVWLSDLAPTGALPFTPKDARDHLLKLDEAAPAVDAAALNTVPPHVWRDALPPGMSDLAEPPSADEVRAAIRAMRDSAPGDDEVSIGMIRAASARVQEQDQFGETPFRGLQILLFKKKGLRTDLNNYRGICLLSVLSRILAKTVATRLARWAEEAGVHSNTQWGNRKYRSTRDAILVARATMEEVTRLPRAPGEDTLCLILFDIMKAFPSVPRPLLRAVLLRLALPAALVDLVIGLHDVTFYVVRTAAGDSDPYCLRRGVREGCPTSGLLFTLYHAVVMAAILPKLPKTLVTYDPERPLPRAAPAAETKQTLVLDTLCFVDDTTALQEKRHCAATEQVVSDGLRAFGSLIHPGKTERYLPHGAAPATGAEPAWQPAVKLLGAWFDANGSYVSDDNHRLEAARKAWRALWRQMPRLGLTVRQRGPIVQAAVISSLLYGAEVRAFHSTTIVRYQRFVDRMVRGLTTCRLRSMKGLKTGTDLRREAGILSIEVQVKRRQYQYLGHVARYPPERVERCILGAWIPGVSDLTMGRGEGNRLRLRTQYRARIREVMCHTDVPEAEWPQRWMATAADRAVWQAAVREAVMTAEEHALRDSWVLRHSAEAEAARQLQAAAPVHPEDGTLQCPKCQRWFPKQGFRHHARQCDGGLAKVPPRRTLCDRCGKTVSCISDHQRRPACREAAAAKARALAAATAGPPPPARQGERAARAQLLRDGPREPVVDADGAIAAAAADEAAGCFSVRSLCH
ncbi:unnamed protein product [Prorocentrum cordatum]|uniref:Reverse transcriptase domain-containing protein n=1 Tax=Prorocentrum cordatum TaxID=2364126 RepID=A0ABN9W667_9DINO|nr:unnamed protein product [Polarella glacialis]